MAVAPAEAAPAEQKPAEAKPAEQKPAEAAPAEQKPAEAKPAEQKPAEAAPAEQKKDTVLTKDDEGEGKDLNGAPEGEYEDFTLPENVEIDSEQLKGFAEVAKELNLSQKGAQKLVDFDAARQAQAAEQQAKAWSEAVEGWLTNAKDDKEIGGDKFDASVEVAKRAIDAYGTPELVQLMNDLGVGNHPEIIRFAYRAGKAISESDVPGGSSKQSPKSLAERLYPTMSQ